MISWIKRKLNEYRAPDIAEAAPALVKLDEILKLKPELESCFPYKLSDYISTMQSEYGFDIVSELLSTPAIGELSVEAHARRIVRAYAESDKFEGDSWLDKLLPQIESVSKKLSEAYGT
ncbi:hypothetical protein ACSTJ7_09595 [Vibrio parahaemolyticus]|uniref:hypothetical protein n=1 Tax=Vibrio parahaemolyticus TaxID=670 RepID=UPI00111CACC9|nr:hypothetical protein [Vibrio parahaemolyticus]TOF96995.1 hypothetical protein CGJ10_22935 [Vibrio parahaemolyticus]HCG8138160.1 hypothetical protein [Vibrio parahaemolyticus]HCG8143426.1 hypothetical protein [Vibrio parahaemolyticus]HCG9605493.1 hypothetical protein [Vibrio parahaemolyticus]